MREAAPRLVDVSSDKDPGVPVVARNSTVEGREQLQPAAEKPAFRIVEPEVSAYEARLKGAGDLGRHVLVRQHVRVQEEQDIPRRGLSPGPELGTAPRPAGYDPGRRRDEAHRFVRRTAVGDDDLVDARGGE